MWGTSVVTRATAASAQSAGQGIGNVLTCIAAGLQAKRQKEEAIVIRHLESELYYGNKIIHAQKAEIKELKQELGRRSQRWNEQFNENIKITETLSDTEANSTTLDRCSIGLLDAAEAGKAACPEYQELKSISQRIRTAWSRDKSYIIRTERLGDRINTLIKTISPTAKPLY